MAQIEKIKRRQTVGEEIANSVSHGVMVIFGIYALIALLINSSTGWSIAASIIFGISIIFLYAMSTLYHALAFTGSRMVFKRFDHLAIYMLIGGTFAPALLLLPSLRAEPFLNIDGFLDTGLTLFIMQWSLIIVGVVLKSIWVNKFQVLHVVIFLCLGWSAIIFIGKLYAYSHTALWLILAGGICYSVGVFFYSLSRIKYFHFIWHLFVAAGTVLQYIAIIAYLVH